MHKIVFKPVTLPKGAVLEYSLFIFWDRYFFTFLDFLITIQLLYIKFFTDVVSIILRVTSLIKHFHSISLSAGSRFKVFWGACSSISLKMLHLILWSFAQMFLYFSDSQCAENNSKAYIPQLGQGTFCSISGAILSIFLHVLRNLKYFLDILH